jgi:hypothetical protein
MKEVFREARLTLATSTVSFWAVLVVLTMGWDRPSVYAWPWRIVIAIGFYLLTVGIILGMIALALQLRAQRRL